jgi:ribonucleoside-triphosphate reductase
VTTGILSFTLPDNFIDSYTERPVDWGFTDAGGNSLGEITFIRTYSRIKPDGTKERWHETCRRVIEGMFSIQKDHAKTNRLPWNDNKAQKTAQDAYERLFSFKWTPPGRGLWVMGTELVNEQKNSAALQNCAFVSTADMTRLDPAQPLCFLMEASMLGVGVGFDAKGADREFEILKPEGDTETYQIPDTREGWVESVRLLINSFLVHGKRPVDFDYSVIRVAGEPIKTFGGTAAGPDPLKRLHDEIRNIFDGRQGDLLNRNDIADIGNLIGVCVVSGNVRRSAELLIGSIDDPNFLDLKNFGQQDPETYQYVTEGPSYYRRNWGWMSNNSVEVSVGQDLAPIIDGIKRNGEPGVIWMDVSRKYGRLVDPATNADARVAGYNPCAEQSLESYEMCTLVETFLNRHENLDDYKKTLKVAFMYAKTVTLLPTHWDKTNAIMQRNRRIGTSASGIANFADTRGMTELRNWLNTGYETVRYYDKTYSEWLCVRESVKVTTVKPSGTVSILAGESPGVHWSPGGEYFLRAMRLSVNDPLVAALKKAKYNLEPDVTDPKNTMVAYFPIHSKAKRSEKDVTIFEKANLAVLAQRYWSDNSVSVTVSFDPETEGEHVGTLLHMHDGQLKTISFLPMMEGAYVQLPYGELDSASYEASEGSLKRVDMSALYEGAKIEEAVGEAFCTTDVCLIELPQAAS